MKKTVLATFLVAFFGSSFALAGEFNLYKKNDNGGWVQVGSYSSQEECLSAASFGQSETGDVYDCFWPVSRDRPRDEVVTPN